MHIGPQELLIRTICVYEAYTHVHILYSKDPGWIQFIMRGGRGDKCSRNASVKGRSEH